MFSLITSDPAILGGKPIIRGTRISVAMILEWIASGATRDDIVRKHPHLSTADVEEALAYAAATVRNDMLGNHQGNRLKLCDFPLLTDENLDSDVVAYLRGVGFDVLDVVESGLQGAADVDLLRQATAQGRVVVTHDADFGTLAILQNEPLVGLVYLRPGHIDTQFTVATIQAVLSATPTLSRPLCLLQNGRATMSRFVSAL